MQLLTVSRWKAEVAAGAALASVGAFFVIAALRLPPPDEPGVPGAGTAPLLIGGFIAVCGLISAALALLKRDGTPLDLASGKQAIALAGLILGAALFEAAGFVLATFVFLAVGFTVLGEADWRRAMPAAAFVSLALWLIFTKLLGVGLPYGLIAELLFR